MVVTRTEQQFIRKNHPLYEIVDRHCFYSKNVYNQANYLIRQAFIKKNKVLSAFDVQKLMQEMDCYKECVSQAAQKTIQLTSKAWKSFFNAAKEYAKHPEKFLGRPRLPKYLPKDGRQVFMLKNIQCSLNDGIFRISYKPFNQYTVPTHATGKLIQCRFIPKEEYYIMEIVYEIDVPDCEEKISRICSVDLGIQCYTDRDLHCCFNIYKRPESGVLNKKPSAKLNDITIYRQDSKGSDNKEFDIRMCYWGDGTAGKILKDDEHYSAEYKIKVNDEEKREEVIRVLSTFDWKEYLNCIAMRKIQQFHIVDVLKENVEGIK